MGGGTSKYNFYGNASKYRNRALGYARQIWRDAQEAIKQGAHYNSTWGDVMERGWEMAAQDAEYDELHKNDTKKPDKKQQKPRQEKSKVDGSNRQQGKDWVFNHLDKQGKDVYSLNDVIMRRSKAELLRDFKDWGLSSVHSKQEMAGIIMRHLQDMGYK